MALATRCPYCQTTFRVVHDQLKLRSGMVRCGQCQHIFNGIEHLVRANTENPAIPAPAVPANPSAPQPPIQPSAQASIQPTVQPTIQAAAQPPVPAPAPLTPPPATAASIATPAPATSASPPSPATQGSAAAPGLVAPAPAASPVSATLPAAAPAPAVPAEAAVSTALPITPATPPAPPAAATPAVAPAPEMAAAREEPDAPDAPLEHDAPDTPHAPPPWQDTEVDPAFASARPETATEPDHATAAPVSTWPETLPTTPPVATPVADPEQRIEPTLDDDHWPDNRNTLDVARAVESLEQHTSPEAAADTDEPDFVKSGRRRQKWQRVWFWLQALSLLLLLLLLAAQAIYTWRDVIAARWPITKPHLQQACTLLHCKVELPTQIHMLSLELGELQALPRNKNTFSYATLLRNTSKLPQSWPGIELVLLDANDHVVARRIFAPQDYQITQQERSKGFAAQSEHAVKLYFETAPQLKALGYRAEIFYP